VDTNLNAGTLTKGIYLMVNASVVAMLVAVIAALMGYPAIAALSSGIAQFFLTSWDLRILAANAAASV
jgi:hypothetical protein